MWAKAVEPIPIPEDIQRHMEKEEQRKREQGAHDDKVAWVRDAAVRLFSAMVEAQKMTQTPRTPREIMAGSVTVALETWDLVESACSKEKPDRGVTCSRDPNYRFPHAEPGDSGDEPKRGNE